MPRRTVLVTGAAGFIGFHVARRLLREGDAVIGVDNVNPYYSVELKRARLARLEAEPRFDFREQDLADREATAALFASGGFDRVLHLAAQAGVRYSLTNPHAYVDANLVAFANVLEGCRQARTPHFVYGSSSSVYGDSEAWPLRVGDPTDAPVSLYAATKKANELMAHAYAHTLGLPSTGLRFFTVYGPWGRPDMACFKFVEAIESGEPIELFNEGRMQRDFTYVDDIVEGIVRVLEAPPQAGHRVYNIGRGQPVTLGRFVEIVESALGKTALKRMAPMQPGDVGGTFADVGPLERDFGWRPGTALEDGVARFVEWYRSEWPSVGAEPPESE